MDNSSIFVIIVTFNAEPWLSTCLGSLRNSRIKAKTIVIDNCSTDGTWEVLGKDYPEVERIRTESNIGFGRGNNIGIRKACEAGADYVFLLNQDAWITPETLGNLIDAHKKHPAFGILSPMHLNAEGNALDYNFRNFICATTNSDSILSDLFLHGPSGLQPVYSTRFINAALWLLPRNTIDFVGGFNPFFFMYGEDRDYVNRCRFHDLAIGFVPSAIGHHGRAQKDSTSKQEHMRRQRLDVMLLDPNYSRTVGHHLRDLAAQAIVSGIFLDWRGIKRHLNDFWYVFKRGNEIRNNRVEVCQKKPTFLFD